MSDTRPFRLVVNKAALPPEISGIYLITDQLGNLMDRVSLALRGGISILQYRAKDLGYDERRVEAEALKKLCKRFGTTFIINDDLQQAYARVSAIIAAERARCSRVADGVEAFVAELLGGA